MRKSCFLHFFNILGISFLLFISPQINSFPQEYCEIGLKYPPEGSTYYRGLTYLFKSGWSAEGARYEFIFRQNGDEIYRVAGSSDTVIIEPGSAVYPVFQEGIVNVEISVFDRGSNMIARDESSVNIAEGRIKTWMMDGSPIVFEDTRKLFDDWEGAVDNDVLVGKKEVPLWGEDSYSSAEAEWGLVFLKEMKKEDINSSTPVILVAMMDGKNFNELGRTPHLWLKASIGNNVIARGGIHATLGAIERGDISARMDMCYRDAAGNIQRFNDTSGSLTKVPIIKLSEKIVDVKESLGVDIRCVNLSALGPESAFVSQKWRKLVNAAKGISNWFNSRFLDSLGLQGAMDYFNSYSGKNYFCRFVSDLFSSSPAFSVFHICKAVINGDMTSEVKYEVVRFISKGVLEGKEYIKSSAVIQLQENSRLKGVGSIIFKPSSTVIDFPASGAFCPADINVSVRVSNAEVNGVVVALRDPGSSCPPSICRGGDVSTYKSAEYDAGTGTWVACVKGLKDKEIKNIYASARDKNGDWSDWVCAEGVKIDSAGPKISSSSSGETGVCEFIYSGQVDDWSGVKEASVNFFSGDKTINRILHPGESKGSVPLDTKLPLDFVASAVAGDGKINIYIKAEDAVGNVSNKHAVIKVVDAIPPEIIIDTPGRYENSLSCQGFLISGRVSDNVSVSEIKAECLININSELKSLNIWFQSGKTVYWNTAIPEDWIKPGDFVTVYITAKDKSGNTKGYSAGWSIEDDNTAPKITVEEVTRKIKNGTAYHLIKGNVIDESNVCQCKPPADIRNIYICQGVKGNNGQCHVADPGYFCNEVKVRDGKWETEERIWYEEGTMYRVSASDDNSNSASTEFSGN